MNAGKIAATSAAMTAEALAIWEAGAGERRRLQLVGLIDRALTECEERNLAAGDDVDVPDVPDWIGDLVEFLMRETGEVGPRPRHTIAAHGVLLDLQERFLPGSPISAEAESAWLAGDAAWLRGRREGRW